MELSWDESLIHVIDFEGGPRCGIVEFGVVTIRGFSIESIATRLCRPKAPIPASEEAVHGISSVRASRESPFEDEWERFAGLRETGPLAAHFAGAENSMLKSVFPYPRMSPNWLDDGGSCANWGPWIDTGVLYREFGDADDSLKLEDLVRRQGLQGDLDALARARCPEGRQRYHCALYDALASALLLTRFCQEICERPPTRTQLIAKAQGSAAKREKVEQRELF